MFKSSALKLNDSDAAFRRRGAAGLVSGKRGKQSQIRQADIVNSKRVGSVLTMALAAQLASNERRSKSCPSRPFLTAMRQNTRVTFAMRDLDRLICCRR